MCAVDYMINEMYFCHVIIINCNMSVLSYLRCLRSCVNLIKLLRVESMHLHNYETVELYAQSDGGAFAQSDGEAY